jgi:hypothetical protein
VAPLRIAGALLLLLGLGPTSLAADDVAVVVHPANRQGDVSRFDLVKMFRLEQQHWGSGGKIYLILLESGSPEKEVVLKRIYRMTDVELKQYWLGKLYRGEIASFPRIASSAAAVKRIVSHAPNALGFIAAGDVDASVKVLRVDGKKPGDPGYLLAAP